MKKSTMKTRKEDKFLQKIIYIFYSKSSLPWKYLVDLKLLFVVLSL